MKKILVIDDDEGILDVLTMILEMERFTVEVSTHGENLTNRVINLKPDIIILDIALGLLDGRDLCNDLKGNEQTKHIPVILFSALQGRFVSEELKCTPNDFIAKPFDTIDLIKRIKAQF